MTSLSDQELLREFALHHTEAAFVELVRRHVDLVHSAARRLMAGCSHSAEDVTQQVFAELARQASRLTKHRALEAWLYTTTRFVASNTRRAEARRHGREQEFATMNYCADSSAADPNWEAAARVLEDAMHDLDGPDRTAVLMRYFSKRGFRAVGEALGVNEDAARMRVNRAVEKLQLLLQRRGVALSAAGVGTWLATEAVTAAPMGLAASVCSVAAATTAGTGTTFTLFNLAAMTKLQAGIVGAMIVACVTTPMLIHNRTQIESLRQQIGQLAEVSAENERLSQQVAQTKPAPRLPAPRMRVPVPAEPAPEESRPTNLIAGILRGGQAPKLTSAQVASYLQENRRNAASLLAAYRTTGNAAMLQEAMQTFPNDSQVAFEAAFQKDVSPEARRQWLDALKQSAPQNAFADYLSAAEHFKAGRTDHAVQDLIAASSKPQFQDFTLERVQDDEEAYRVAGYSVAEAKTIPSMQLLLPQLAQMKELSQGLAELAKSYRQAGDESSAPAILRMAANLGQRYSNLTPGEPEVSQLVGMAIEHIALNAMDANAPYGSAGQTVNNRLEQLTQQRTDLQQLAKQTEALMPKLTDQDWISYKDRWRNFGEEAAGRWLINKYGKPSP